MQQTNIEALQRQQTTKTKLYPKYLHNTKDEWAAKLTAFIFENSSMTASILIAKYLHELSTTTEPITEWELQ